MTTELTMLTLTALLAASLWIPYIVGINTTPVPELAENRPHDPGTLAPWVHRAFRAHLNLLEQFLPFAVVVLVAHLVGISNSVTIYATTAFFAIRLVHSVWMISGMTVLPGRPIIFSLGWLCILAMVGALFWG